MLRTDLAMELTTGKCDGKNKIKRTDVTLDAESARRLGKPVGNYTTVESNVVVKGKTAEFHRLAKVLSGILKEFSKMPKSVLVVGLGNPDMTADALGNEVFKNLTVTRHIVLDLKSTVALSAVCPNVMGVTGIESFDIIKGVVDRTKPNLVIVVDSLASAAVKRIGQAFQITSAGITPGSGVSNHRIRLDKQSLGVEVISFGVPLVVYASTIIKEACGDTPPHLNDDLEGLVVTPKDIDLLVADCGKVIAEAINLAYVGDNLFE